MSCEPDLFEMRVSLEEDRIEGSVSGQRLVCLTRHESKLVGIDAYSKVRHILFGLHVVFNSKVDFFPHHWITAIARLNKSER